MTTTYPKPTDPVTAFTRGDGTTEGHDIDHGRAIGIWENTKHQGATHVDVVTNDDTAAVQRTIDAAKVSPGGIVRLPPGTPRITSSLLVDASAVWLQGSGELTTQIHLDHPTAAALRVDGGGGGISSFRLSDMTISCFLNTAGVYTRTAGQGIYLNNVGDYHIENVVVNHGWDAVYLNQAHTGTLRNVKATDEAVNLSGQRTCFYIANSISTKLDNCHASSAHGSSLTGFDIEGGVDTLTMDHCGAQGVTQFAYGMRTHNTVGASAPPRWIRVGSGVFEVDDTNGFGVELGASYDVEFDGLYTKGGKYGVHIGGSARGLRFLGGVIQLAQQYGVLVDAADGLDFIGTLVTDNGQAADNTYDGIIVAGGASNFSFWGVRSGNILWNGAGGFHVYQKHGISIQAGCSNYRYGGLDLRNNRTSGLEDLGTGKVEGFYTTTPIVKQTGVAVSAAAIHAALVNLGLISA